MESNKHLPEHCLKEKQTTISKTQKEAVPSYIGVPFRAVKGERVQHPYTIQKFDSPLWNLYEGAYGNVSEYLDILMGEREEAPETFQLRRLDKTPKTNYEMAFDNLCENLWHQMSFYHATWLALPYMARLMENWKKEADTEWLFQGILMVGCCLATDVFGDKPEENEVRESYENAILQIRDMTIDFLTKDIEYVREKNIHWRRAFAYAVMAILGEKELSYLFFMSDLESCYIACPSCENCDEEIEFGYFDPLKRIEKTDVPVEQWDGESFEDVKVWLFNLFSLLNDKEGMEILCYYFGTYTCPECGEKMPVLTGMKEYFLV